MSAIALKAVRGYHVGGTLRTVSGLERSEIQAARGGPVRLNDPNGDYVVDPLYVQQFSLQAPLGACPLLMWHGGGMTGVTWEDMPDGRAGWHDWFMRAGYDTCVSDAVERGRAGWSRYPAINPQAPVHRTLEEAWHLFRFGPAGGYAPDARHQTAYPGQRFPVAAIGQLGKQFVARWTNSTAPTQRAYDTLVKHIGPSIILAHSQGGFFALDATRHAPHLVRAVILVEPAAAPTPHESWPDGLTAIPHLVVWGDYFEHSPLWCQYRTNVERYLDALRAAGAEVTTLDLPARGIRGNSHLLMMDDNSHIIAAMIHSWLRQHGLHREPDAMRAVQA